MLLLCQFIVHGQTTDPDTNIQADLESSIDINSIDIDTDISIDTDLATDLDIDIDTDLDTDISLDIDLTAIDNTAAANTVDSAAPADFDEILRLLEALNIETEVVTRNIIPEDDLVEQEEETERTEDKEPSDPVQLATEEVTPTVSPVIAQPEPEVEPEPEIEQPPSTAEVVAETLDNIIVTTIEKEMRKKRIPKKQPWLELGVDYYLTNFATNKRFDPFASIHGLGGLSLNVKGVEFFYGFNAISQEFVENSIYNTFEAIEMTYSSMGLSYQHYLDSKFSIHVGVVLANATGSYMGENLKEASQTAVFIGGNYDVFESVTLRMLFVPYLTSVFELDDLEGSNITYDFINDTKITTTETFNNVFIGMTWSLPYVVL